MLTKNEKRSYLTEMFETLEPNWIEKLIEKYPNNDIPFLVDQCLEQPQQQEEKEEEEENKNKMNENDEILDMISLIPASFTNTNDQNNNNNNNNNNMDIDDNENEKKELNISMIPEYFHSWFEEQQMNKEKDKEKDNSSSLFLILNELIVLCDHCEAMRMQHTMLTSNEITSTTIEMKEFEECMEMTLKLMKNMKENPNDLKYQHLRSDNKVFVKKIAHINGHRLLLEYIGFQFNADGNEKKSGGNDSNVNGTYVYNINDNNKMKIDLLFNFMTHYLNYLKTLDSKNKNNEKIIDFNSIPIIEKQNKKTHTKENSRSNANASKKIVKLTQEELREQRLKKLSKLDDSISTNEEYKGNGPIADKIMDLNQPNLRQELLEIGKHKHTKWRNTKLARQRVFTMDDIKRMKKEEFDSKARGPTSTSKQSNEMDTIGKEALRLTNEFRKSQGLPILQWHQSLCDIGKEHSKNMGDGKVPFGHDGFKERVSKYPFQPLSAAENVAMNNGFSSEQVAKISVDGWIQSPGHRKNMLANHNYCGIGVYQNSQGAYYLTQLFGLTHL